MLTLNTIKDILTCLPPLAKFIKIVSKIITAILKYTACKKKNATPKCNLFIANFVEKY